MRGRGDPQAILTILRPCNTRGTKGMGVWPGDTEVRGQKMKMQKNGTMQGRGQRGTA